MTMFWKKMNLDTQGQGGGGQYDTKGQGSLGGVCGQNTCTMLLHLWFPLIWYAKWPCSKKVNNDLLTLIRWLAGVGGSAGKIFAVGWGLQEKYLLPCAGKIIATMVLHLQFPLTWCATYPCSEKVGFWHFDQRVGCVWVSADKIFATMLLHLRFPLIWYATWPCSEK